LWQVVNKNENKSEHGADVMGAGMASGDSQHGQAGFPECVILANTEKQPSKPADALRSFIARFDLPKTATRPKDPPEPETPAQRQASPEFTPPPSPTTTGTREAKIRPGQALSTPGDADRKRATQPAPIRTTSATNHGQSHDGFFGRRQGKRRPGHLILQSDTVRYF